MGLFRKSSKGKPKYLDVNLDEFNVKWVSLTEALPSIIDAGSQDVKRNEFKHPLGSYLIFSHDGKVKGVLPPTSDFTVAEYLTWVPPETLPEEVKQRLREASNQSDLYRYEELSSLVPEAKNFLYGLYSGLNLEAALTLESSMKAMPLEVLTEPVYSEKLENAITQWDFFDKTPDEMSLALESSSVRVEHAYERMGLTDRKAAPLQLQGEWTASTPIEAYLHRKATEGASVEALIAKRPQGMLAFTILENLEKLLLQKKLVVEGQEEKVEEALPDFDFDAAASVFTEVEREELPEEVEEDEEWAFEEEILTGEEDKPHFIPTGFMHVNLRPLIYPLIKEYNFEDDKKRKVRALLRENAKLEKQVLELEETLAPLSAAYAHGIDVYDAMKLDKSLEDLENDASDPTEAEVESVEDEPEMVEKREECNREFFVLSRLEEERFKVNEARKKALYGLLGSVPFEEDDPRTLHLQDVIEEKLRGISHVRTMVYHVPVDPSGHDRLVEELIAADATFIGADEELPLVEDVKEEVQERTFPPFIDEPDPRPTSNTPIYYQLVDELGLDPLELYKEDQRILREGGNPHAPRPTKYSRYLQEAWEALQANSPDALHVEENRTEPTEE